MTVTSKDLLITHLIAHERWRVRERERERERERASEREREPEICLVHFVFAVEIVSSKSWKTSAWGLTGSFE